LDASASGRNVMVSATELAYYKLYDTDTGVPSTCDVIPYPVVWERDRAESSRGIPAKSTGFESPNRVSQVLAWVTTHSASIAHYGPGERHVKGIDAQKCLRTRL
jgi:hypothetical protein